MLKSKLLLLLSYGIILNYFGETLHSLPQFFAPILYLGFGSFWYQLEAILLIICFLYLGLSSLLFPYNEGKGWLLIILIFISATLLIPILDFTSFPKTAQWKFGISLMIYAFSLIHIIKNLKLFESNQ